MLLLLAGCAWIGGQTHEDNLERWSVVIDTVAGDLQRCSPSLEVQAIVSRQRAAEEVTLEVRLDGQTASADAVVADDGSVRWTVGPFEPLSANELTYQLVVDQTAVPWTSTFVSLTRYIDADEDGFGDEETTACDPQQPVVDDAEPRDCDDSDPDVNPAADELCTQIDENCDGLPTAGAIDIGTWYVDSDGDGVGNDELPTVEACEQPPHTAPVGGDCNDHVALIGVRTWAPDADHDGLGSDDPTTWLVQCDPPSLAHVNNTDDCNDADASVGNTVYIDGDGDGFGDVQTTGCPGTGLALDHGDCDDADAQVNPDQPELCTPDIDEDCDGDNTANAADTSFWHPDGDGDSFGDGAFMVAACSPPGGYVADATDCDDNRTNVYPGSLEVCDTLDNDCTGQPDDGLTGIFIGSAAQVDFQTALSGAQQGETITLCEDVTWPSGTLTPASGVTIESAGRQISGSGRVDHADLTLVGLELVGGTGTMAADTEMEGGVLTAQASTIRVTDSTLSCTAPDPLDRGGALQMHASALTLDGVTISGCSAVRGGAIDLVSSSLETLGTLTELRNNTADYGGAISATRDNGVNSTLAIGSNILVEDNEAHVQGGGAYLSQVTGVLAGSWSSNTANAGGGMYAIGATTDLDVTGIWRQNEATISGGGMFLNNLATVQLTDAGVRLNTAPYGAGAYVGGDASFTTQGGTFEGNVASVSGGGIGAEGAVFVDGTRFEANSAGTPGSYTDANTGGGLAAFTDGAVRLDNSTFVHNQAFLGAGLLIAPGQAAPGSLDLRGTTVFAFNVADGQAGGIWASGSNVQLSGDVTFEQNTSGTGDGGALLLSDNSIDGPLTSSQACGVLSGDATVRFEANASGGNGGGMALLAGSQGPCTLQLAGQVSFVGNQALDGAAIEMDRVGSSSQAMPHFSTGLDLEDNTPTGPAGTAMIHVEVESGSLNEAFRSVGTTFVRTDAMIAWVHLTDGVVFDESYDPELASQPRELVCTSSGCNAL